MAAEKQKFHNGESFNLFHWRTSNQKEIDLIIDFGMSNTMIEIKASETYRPSFHKTLSSFSFDNSEKIVVYQGKTDEKIEGIWAYNYKDFLLDYLENREK